MPHEHWRSRERSLSISPAIVLARLINAMADIVLCHGGQGTIQTAICSGTPLAGLATQPEQQVNLHHVAAFGAGIRIPLREWESGTIRRKISDVLKDGRYKARAIALGELFNQNDGRKNSAMAVWQFIGQRGLF